MKKRVWLTGPIIKILAIVAVVLGFAIVLYSNSGFPSPRESDRITAFDGSFSVIKPRDWDSRVVQASPDNSVVGAIEISSPKATGVSEQLTVERLRDPPDIAKLKSTGYQTQSFQSGEAWVLGKRTKLKLDNVITVYFESADQNWYRMELHVGVPDQELRDTDWWPFVMSFKSRAKASGATRLSSTNAVDRRD